MFARLAIGTGKLKGTWWERAVVQNAARGLFCVSFTTFTLPTYASTTFSSKASVGQLVEHALRKDMVVGSSPTGGLSLPLTAAHPCSSRNEPSKTARNCGGLLRLVTRGKGTKRSRFGGSSRADYLSRPLPACATQAFGCLPGLHVIWPVLKSWLPRAAFKPRAQIQSRCMV